MKILALNSGSSSIKYRLFDSSNYQLLKQGLAERIGQKASSICQIIEIQPAHKKEVALSDYRIAMHTLFPNENKVIAQQTYHLLNQSAPLTRTF